MRQRQPRLSQLLRGLQMGRLDGANAQLSLEPGYPCLRLVVIELGLKPGDSGLWFVTVPKCSRYRLHLPPFQIHTLSAECGLRIRLHGGRECRIGHNSVDDLF